MLGLVASNLRGSPGRTALTALGIAIGIGTIVGLLAVTAGLGQAAGGLLHLGKGELAMFQQNAADPTASLLPQQLVSRVAKRPEVRQAVGLRLLTGAVPRDTAALVFGVQPGSFVAQRLVFTAGGPPFGSPGAVAVGFDLAQRLHLRPGDRLTVAHHALRVSGVYHSGVSFEDSGATLALSAAQALSHRPHDITLIGVTLKPTVTEAHAQHALMRAFPGTTVITQPGEAVRATAGGALIDKAVLVITVLALVLGGVGVTNTMVMAALERRRELALLGAVGWSPGQVAALIFVEGIAVSILGAAAGLAIGVAAAEGFARALSTYDLVSPDITAWVLGRGLLVGIAIGVLGGLYPAWRVTRLAPARELARV